MDNIIDELIRIARRCERTLRTLDGGPVDEHRKRVLGAADEVGRAWSGSWIDYQATVYLDGLRRPRPGEHFNKEWGFLDISVNTGAGPWREFTYDEVESAILSRSGVSDLEPFRQAATQAGQTFRDCKDELLPSLDAILTELEDQALQEVRQKLVEMPDHFSRAAYLEPLIPRGQHVIRDPRAQAGSGFRAPHHLAFEGWVIECLSYMQQLRELGKLTRYAANYLQKRMGMKGKTIGKKDGRVFIGHGRSKDWRDLKDFIEDRLHLTSDEFNSEPTAGKTTKERLEEMLDSAGFAFLVMTAEDEHADGTRHARENVIHEIGLFQGRLGFERAIVLLEEGCQEFSNITGLTQIRFPPGNIMAKSEEIRRTLEREGLI